MVFKSGGLFVILVEGQNTLRNNVFPYSEGVALGLLGGILGGGLDSSQFALFKIKLAFVLIFMYICRILIQFTKTIQLLFNILQSY